MSARIHLRSHRHTWGRRMPVILKRAAQWVFISASVMSCGAKTGFEVDAYPPLEPPPPECEVDQDCDDRFFCSGIETCRAGRCIPGTPVACTDNNICTDDRCDDAARRCIFTEATRDADGDGHRGTRPNTVLGQPEACGDDCNDEDRTVFPGATEICNGRDDNCNGVIDDNATFTPAGPDVAVSEPSLSPASVGGVAWSGERYLASFWGYENNGAHVYFTARNRDGSAAMNPETNRITLSSPDAFGASVAWNGRVLGLAWSDRRDGDYEIYFNRLNANGEKLGADQRVTFTRGFSLNPTITWTGEDFVIAWQDERDSFGLGGRTANFEIYLQRIDGEGRQIEENIRLTRDPANSESPVVVAGANTVGVVWLDGRGGMPNAEGNRGIYFAPLTASLQRLSMDQRVTPMGTDAIAPVLAFNRDRWVLAWHDAAENSVDHEIWGAVRSPSGSEILAPIKLSMDRGFSRYPSLVALGDRVLVVWADDRSGDGYDVWARMFSAELQPLSTEQRVTMAPRDSVYPLAELGPNGDVGILFRDQREGRWRVRFTRLQCAIRQ